VAELLHEFGPYLVRARLEAAERLGKPELRTVAGAARELKIGKSTLYHYEDGTKRPSLEALEAMAAGYGCLVGDLLPSRNMRGAEVQGILSPLLAIPAAHRAMVIRQLAAQAESYAALYDAGMVNGGGFPPQTRTTEERIEAERRRETPGEQPGLMLS
jgi:transcriptional regulator with XRE-family HTH domain